MPKKCSKSKPRGPMSPYACFVHICREEVRKDFPNESVMFGQFSRQCGQRWKTMTDKQKKFFQRLSKSDHVRYKNELKDYPKIKIPTKVYKKKNKNKVNTTNNLPVKPLKAFYWFCKFERPKVKKANPTFSGGDVTRELGRMWRKLGQSLKKSYDMMADVDKTRYEDELEALGKQENKNIEEATSQKASSSVEIVSQQSSEEKDDEEEEDENEDILIEIVNSDDDDLGEDVFLPANELLKVYYENGEEEKAEPEFSEGVYVEENYDDDIDN